MQKNPFLWMERCPQFPARPLTVVRHAYYSIAFRKKATPDRKKTAENPSAISGWILAFRLFFPKCGKDKKFSPIPVDKYGAFV